MPEKADTSGDWEYTCDMRDTSSSVPPAFCYPMPDHLYRGYRWLWHLLSLGLLALILGLALWDTRTAWDWRQAALIGLVSLQIALHLKTFVLNHPWPLPWW